jgi:predicted cupin superfamily sugar epimerase
MGTTMAPGFDFDDYEHADKNELIEKYPNRKSLIERLTKEQD